MNSGAQRMRRTGAGAHPLARAAVWAVALAAVFLAGCGERYARPVLPATYVVKSGDTVYSIAWRHGLDYQKLARWNELPADYRIYPGQVLRLYPPSGRAPSTGSNAGTRPPRAPVSTPAKVAEKDRVAQWLWPTQGLLKEQTAPGLLIVGREGQQVKAAAPGRVVYTGSGLRAYGQLIIIKHSDAYLSAYGHNRALKVREGEQVRAGQIIAEMGIGPGLQPALYFEIRLNGKPVDPLQFLPRRH